MSYQHATHRTSLHKHSKYEADYAASDQMLPHDEQLISCEICIESVPVSQAQISEAGDYVAYFCGLECYELWITQSTANNK